jgi:hypothetical protein
MNQQAIYQVEGNKGKVLLVFEDHCVIQVKRGFSSFVNATYTNGDKVIYYADVISVKFKECGLQIGYLLFETAANTKRSDQVGFRKVSRVNNTAFNDENSFTFKWTKQNALMKEIHNFVQRQIAAVKQGQGAVQVQQAVSPAEELKKFKELLDMGIITAGEFENKKMQILNS